MSFRNKKPTRQFKKNIDLEDSRRKREDHFVQLRNMKREENLMKRRQQRGGTNIQNQEVMEKLQMLPQLVQGVHSDEPQVQLESVTQFRQLLSIEHNPPIEQVIASGVVPRLVEFLRHNHNPSLQFEAAWALTNIASGTTEDTQVVIQNGAVGIFVQLLKSENVDVREQAVWALGNIAGDSHQCRDLVLKSNSLQPLLELFTNDAKMTMLRNATWTLSNFCRGKPQPPFEFVEPALPTLAKLIMQDDDEVLTDACWALSYLSDDTGKHNTKITAVIRAGVCPRLVELLMHKNHNVKTPALRTIGNIVTGDDLQTEVVVNCSVLPCLLALLVNPKRGIRKETCWTISNITAGSPEQIEAVITQGLIPPLISILRNAEFDIQKEAAWAISNATSGGRDNQIRYLVEKEVIPPLCALFKCNDPKIVLVAMEGIENILRVGHSIAQRTNSQNLYADYVEECGGVDILEDLQRHDNEEIYLKASNIIRTYIGEEEVDSNLVPEIDGQQFSFGTQPLPNSGFDFPSGKTY